MNPMVAKITLKPGSIIQINPETAKNKAFSACLMVVDEVTAWGVKCHYQGTGTREMAGGQAHYRAGWDEFEDTRGVAEWRPQ